MGHDIEVYLDAEAIKNLPGQETSFYAINTNTRSVDQKTAYQKVRDIAEIVNKRPPTVLYKKIDSVLRGNIGAEVDAVMDATGRDLAVIAPALPKNRRIVRDGFLQVNTSQQSDINQCVAHALYGENTDKNCINIHLAEVRKGPMHLAEVFEQIRKQPRTRCILDAETDEDLAVIAKAIQMCPFLMLPVGSAGLAEQMFSTAVGKTNRQNNLCPASENETLGLIVVTSKHPSTIAQLQRLRERDDTVIFTFEPEDLKEQSATQLAATLADEILNYYGTHSHSKLIVITTRGNIFGHKEKEYCPQRDLSDAGIATTATVAAAIVTKALPVTAVIATGGDAANYFLKNFALEKIRLLEEPIPGMVAARMDAKHEPPRLFLTKSGGFGDENTLSVLADYILTHQLADTTEIIETE